MDIEIIIEKNKKDFKVLKNNSVVLKTLSYFVYWEFQYLKLHKHLLNLYHLKSYNLNLDLEQTFDY